MIKYFVRLDVIDYQHWDASNPSIATACIDTSTVIAVLPLYDKLNKEHYHSRCILLMQYGYINEDDPSNTLIIACSVEDCMAKLSAANNNICDGSITQQDNPSNVLSE